MNESKCNIQYKLSYIIHSIIGTTVAVTIASVVHDNDLEKQCTESDVVRWMQSCALRAWQGVSYQRLLVQISRLIYIQEHFMADDQENALPLKHML